MELHLDPPRGIVSAGSAIPLGAAESAAVRAASRYGPTTVAPAGTINIAGTLFPTPTKITTTGPGFELVLILDDAVSVTAIEVWRPRDPRTDITVRYDGLDVFRTPAAQLLELIRARGHRVETEDEGVGAWAPDLALGFSRVAAHEVPRGADGEPLFFESVLVAAAGYYGD
ncbi:MAG: hypothetical protein HOW97_20155 [Catenulispora sp.]|nr:hypothetical protein [Catenulispora sp.]